MEVNEVSGAATLRAPKKDLVSVEGCDCAIERVGRPTPVAIALELDACRLTPVQRPESVSVQLARVSADRAMGARHRPVLRMMRSHADGPHAVSTASTRIGAIVHNFDTG